MLADLFTEQGKVRRGGVEKPPQPDALAFAINADPAHAIVPVTSTHQWNAMFTRRDRPFERTPAMLVDRKVLGRRFIFGVAFLFAIGQGRAL